MRTEYIIKIDDDYYVGVNEKYPDMHNISGLGPLGAKKMSLNDALKLRAFYIKHDREVEIEEYDPRAYLEEELTAIIRYDDERRGGKDCGYAIKNSAQRALDYLKQI